MRIEQLRDSGERGEAFSFQWDGREVRAHPGESILGALLACGTRTLRHSSQQNEPRGFLCGIGACFECLVTVDGVPGQRACVTPAAPGMVVQPGGPDRERMRGETGDG